ncbi:1682_t:CDS:2 [Entrophospora sp. SA101]|nr:1682_t:CDS:2 [Entrophospora sp. SA101]
MDKDPECPGHKELAPGEQRSTWIYSTDTYLQSQPQKTINQSNFKESYTKPNKPNYLPWILGGIAGLGLIVGLSLYDYEFVSQLKQNKINPEQYAHCKNQTIQEQLDYFYNKSQKIDGYEASILTQLTINNCPQLEKINIRNSESLQQLTLNNLPKLRELYCSENKLTALEINNCANLERINCSYNQLTQIKLPKGEKLELLSLAGNNLNQDLSFLSGLHLKNVSKLKTLDISNTDIDRGLEYLPESVEYFACSANKRKDAKVQAIYNLFADEQGEVETQKQQAIEELENELEGKAFNKRIGVELRQKQKELDKIELRLEKIIEEEKPALMKKLKMDNEN